MLGSDDFKTRDWADKELRKQITYCHHPVLMLNYKTTKDPEIRVRLWRIHEGLCWKLHKPSSVKLELMWWQTLQGKYDPWVDRESQLAYARWRGIREYMWPEFVADCLIIKTYIYIHYGVIE